MHFSSLSCSGPHRDPNTMLDPIFKINNKRNKTSSWIKYLLLHYNSPLMIKSIPSGYVERCNLYIIINHKEHNTSPFKRISTSPGSKCLWAGPPGTCNKYQSMLNSCDTKIWKNMNFSWQWHSCQNQLKNREDEIMRKSHSPLNRQQAFQFPQGEKQAVLTESYKQI